jgi:hypothetical protein
MLSSAKCAEHLLKSRECIKCSNARMQRRLLILKPDPIDLQLTAQGSGLQIARFVRYSCYEQAQLELSIGIEDHLVPLFA